MSSSPLFTTPTPERTSNPLLTWAIAGAVLLLVVGGVLLANHHAPVAKVDSLLPLDPYAANLIFSDVKMSESTSISGGRSIFIDGMVKNAGASVVTGASLQVLFPSFDSTQPPQLESVPLTLIRTHQPYIDTEPVSAAPLDPGASHEFRLIFEDISPNWGQQLPEIHAVRIATAVAATK
jgi:hypothetical protein